MVAKDGVAAELVPEARHPRLAGEDRARVVGAVGALAREDLVDRQRELDDAPVLAVGPIRRRAESDECGARKHDQEDGAEADDAGAHRGPRAGRGEHGVGEGEERRQGGEEERHGVAVESPARGGQERPEPARGLRHARVVGEPPGQDARRVVQGEVARQQQQQPGDHRAVDAERPVGAQAPLPPGANETGTRAPQEHTRLRTAHSIFSRRPHEGQPR